LVVSKREQSAYCKYVLSVFVCSWLNTCPLSEPRHQLKVIPFADTSVSLSHGRNKGTKGGASIWLLDACKISDS